MGVFIFILIIAALVGGIIWNHKNRAAALAGLEFSMPEEPPVVAAAIGSLYCRGAKAQMQRMFSRISVQERGSTGFVFDMKFGDKGEIEVHPENSGSKVRVSASSLYIGGKPIKYLGTGYWAFGRVVSNAMLRAVGYAPNAARMKRFQLNLEQAIARQIGRQVGA